MATPLPSGSQRQNEIALRRRTEAIMQELACESEVNWRRTDRVWIDIDGSEIPIVRLTDARLHSIVCWAIQSHRANWERYADPLERAFNNPAAWLCSTPLFVALVVELAKRELSLPRHLFKFVEDVLLASLENRQPTEVQADPYRNRELLAEQGSTLSRIRQAAAGLVQQSQPPRVIDFGNSSDR